MAIMAGNSAIPQAAALQWGLGGATEWNQKHQSQLYGLILGTIHQTWMVSLVCRMVFHQVVKGLHRSSPLEATFKRIDLPNSVAGAAALWEFRWVIKPN